MMIYIMKFFNFSPFFFLHWAKQNKKKYYDCI